MVDKIDITDPRWGGHCPWFFRYHDFSGNTKSFLLFFDRLSHRIEQLLVYNECGISNKGQFVHNLESKSLRRFRFDKKDGRIANYLQVAEYFEPVKIENELERNKNYKPIINRIGVLEILLKILPKPNGFHDLAKDIRSYLAEAQIMLDIDIKTFEIKLLEEPLLQKEVIEKLMPRLASRYPDRAKELSSAYHDMIGGEKKFDDIFIGAFKTLEALAREITGNNSFEFKKSDLSRYFPNLHPTVHDTIMKLAAHRGSEGGHGRDAPEPHEMRYLLFSICNIALLLLDYKQL